MSKFKVGDRVRCVDKTGSALLNTSMIYLVTGARDCTHQSGQVLTLDDGSTWNSNRFELVTDPPQETPTDPATQDLSHVWQVGKTYKTTLEGVTVKVTEIDDAGDIAGERSDEQFAPWYWVAKTGRMLGRESHKTEPHLLPIEVEPPTVAEQVAAEPVVTDVDPVNHPPHYTNHPSGVECITVTEHMNFCRGNAVKYIWRAGEKGDAVEDLRKAVWYLQREIERIKRKKGGE